MKNGESLKNEQKDVAKSNIKEYNYTVAKEECVMKKINEKIRELREEFHLSQDYVAKYLGMNRTSYTQLENDNRKINAEDISKLCTLLGVSADSLINYVEVEDPVTVFARSFANLDETDRAEIMNLIRFKEQIKAQRSR